jgi:hypothetical protein
MWIRRLFDLLIVACLVLAAGPARAAPPQSGSGDDPLASYRERFKQGMDLYKSGAFAEAIGLWEPIHRELGEEKGYRVAYDLGIAYEEIGDATGAAEHLQSFLAQVDARRSQGEALPAIVAKEEADARDRVASLTAAKGRIRVDPGTPPRAVQVDAMVPRVSMFVAWVYPGEHTVIFGPGTADELSARVEVHAGELVTVAPPPPPEPAPGPPPPRDVPPPAASSEVPPAPPPPPPPTRLEAEHPFSPVVLAVSGGLAVAAGIAAIPLTSHAWALRDQYATETPTIAPGDRSSFDTARSWAYGTTGVAVGLAAITAGLATWYLLGSSERTVVVTPAGVAGRF